MMSSSDLGDCSETAKVPGSSASTNSSSDKRMINTNSGKQDDVVEDVAGDFVKDVGGDFIKDVGRFINISRNSIVNRVARGRGGLPGVLIAGVMIVGVLIAGVFMFKHIKLGHRKVAGKVAGKVAVDASLSATADNNRSWHSSSGDFAFGFRQLNNSDLFLLCIWFDKIPDKTIVWYANGDMPAPMGSYVNLTAKSGLVLKNHKGELLWSSYLGYAGVVAHGVMNDTGNFVLEDDNAKSLWETFKNPTDTMLPGQRIEIGGKLSSRLSEANYTRGRFQLDFQEDGNLVFSDKKEDGNLVFSDKKPFCSTKTTKGNVSGSEGKQLVFDESGSFYIMRVNNGTFNFTAQKYSAMEYYLRLTFNFNGYLAQYYLLKSLAGNVNWKVLWFEPHEVDCGDNCSNCHLNVDPTLTCECPRG